MKIQEYFDKLLKDLESQPDEEGHYNLLKDIWSLWKEATDHEFHDFKNDKYPAPKMALYQKLVELADNVKNGRYDN